MGALVAEGGLRLAGFEHKLSPELVDFGAPSRDLIQRYYLEDEDLLWVPRDYRDTVEQGVRDQPVIVFMGDSCTQLGNYHESLLEGLLRGLPPEQVPSEGIAFLNVACVGWSSYQGRLQLDRDVLAMKPRVVTLFFGWNDHWVSRGVEDKTVARVDRFVQSPLRGLRLVQLWARAALAAHPQAADRPNRVSPEDFRDNLTHMVRTAAANGIAAVLLTAPTSLAPGETPSHLRPAFLREGEEPGPMHQAYAQIVREVGDAEGAVVCDLDASFRALPAEVVRDIYFTEDRIHPTEAGDHKIAEFLLACLREHGLVERLVE